ncbi:hypothetical protein [Ralstonia syzygii]
MKSIERGNAVFGVHINGIRDKNRIVKAQGPNPFDYLGLEVSADGRAGTPTRWDGKQWVYYTDLGRFPINEQPHDKRGKNLQLKTWLRTYDWISDNGFDNFGKWVE